MAKIRRNKEKNLTDKLESYCDLITTISTILGILINAIRKDSYEDFPSLVMFGFSIGLLFISGLTKYQIKNERDTYINIAKCHIEAHPCISGIVTLVVYIIYALLLYCFYKKCYISPVLKTIFVFYSASISAISFILSSIDIIKSKDSSTDLYFVYIVFIITLSVLSDSAYFALALFIVLVILYKH